MSTSAGYVLVSGPGDDATSTDVEVAREVGQLLAARGAVVLTGGLGGVMKAAATGAEEGGGTSVALLPGTDRSVGHGTVVLPTGLGEARNAVLVNCADAVIAVGGSWGTLSEVALARRLNVPVVVIGGWSIDGVELPTAGTAAEAVAFALGPAAAD